ncbi:tRNA 2-thiocytidine biosynthesis protein [sediment metagenome]|uniref:tRNA 2-thiocytidine biosynthesis protein n=1 Tax=sediment metagenome TaxID=749907 RepID=D9PK57_9ZZZZ
METLFMSLTYSGSLRSMAPKYKAENGLEVIRPLIFVRENDIRKFTNKNNIKTIGNEFCVGLKGEKKSYVREEIKTLLAGLESKNQFLFPSIKNALQNPDINSLFVVPKRKNIFDYLFF